MEVVNREPPSQEALAHKFWHLLQEGDTYFIHVNCEQSAAGFSLMVQLTPEEYAEYPRPVQRRASGWQKKPVGATVRPCWMRRGLPLAQQLRERLPVMHMPAVGEGFPFVVGEATMVEDHPATLRIWLERKAHD